MTSLNGLRRLRLTAKETLIASCEVFNTVEPRFTDTRLIRTPRYITNSLLCPWGKKAPTFSLNSIRLIRTPYMPSSVSVLAGFDCTGST